ncbi:hypothetical protein BUE80_DR012875 [Diplocarpon rosae]|nr:hypothetical protein BUE80_DR012875 [Diplocarpon rosae]
MDPMISTALAGADRSTNAPSILAINGAFCGFAFTIVMVRMYARAMVLKAVGKDAGYVGECSNGKGMHSASIRPDEFVRILQWQFYHSVIVTVGISLVKLSTIIFSCLPIRASWDRASEPDAKCFSTSTFTYIGMSNSVVVNILTDVLFASLPIPIVWNLQVNVRTKISLIVIMSLGYLCALFLPRSRVDMLTRHRSACACSIVKTKIQATVFQDADSYRNDSYFSMYGAPRGLSKEDFPIQGDSDSLDDILSTPGMRQSGITKTVHISVQR